MKQLFTANEMLAYQDALKRETATANVCFIVDRIYELITDDCNISCLEYKGHLRTEEIKQLRELKYTIYDVSKEYEDGEYNPLSCSPWWRITWK